MRRLGEEVAVALTAVQFLTRLPVRVDYTPERMAASPRWYPAVGAVVGGMCALVLWLGALVWPMPLAVVVAVAVGLWITGALHEDGLADLCDGLGGGRTRERALDIMRDSRIGTYGLLGLSLVLAMQVLSLAGLSVRDAAATLIAGHGASRGAMTWVLATSRSVRRDGAGHSVAGGLGPGELAFPLGLSLVSAVPLIVVAPGAAFFGMLGLMLCAGLLRWRFERRLGGYTGDCLGAVQMVGHLGVCLGVAAWL